MDHPYLYKIGMDSTQYGNCIFIQWLFLAFWHGAIIFFVCIYCLGDFDTHMNDGQTVGLWYVGHTVYGACVIVANW